jgi:hypothetical protein
VGRRALAAEAKEAVRKHARTRTVLMPPRRAPDTLARFSGGWFRCSVMDSCREAETIAHVLGRLASGGGSGDDGDGDGVVAGHETLVGLSRGDVCCFINARVDGSPIDSRETRPFWTDEDGSYEWHRQNPSRSCHQGSSGYHLGPFPGGEEWVGAVRSDNEMPAEVSGLRGLLPALEQCEALAGVWHPAMCRHFENTGVKLVPYLAMLIRGVIGMLLPVHSQDVVLNLNP